MILSRNNFITVAFVFTASILTGCMAKEITFNEHQKRMQRCEQYIERDRDICMQGGHVTIEDYKDDYKDFEKQNKKQAEKEKPQ
jgi:hypothetical protein